jgi:hypothetical protein
MTDFLAFFNLIMINLDAYEEKMSSNLPVYHPIPLATFQDFFCLKWFATNNRLEALANLPNTPHHFAKLCAEFFELHHLIPELNEAESDNRVDAHFVSEIDGGIAAYVRYYSNGAFRTIILTAHLGILPDDETGETYYGFKPETLFFGEEKKVNGETVIQPEFMVCPVVETDGTYFDCPAKTDEFYAALNYMRFAMLSCLKGDPMSRELNQLLITNIAIRGAQDTFCQSVGLPNILDILEQYSIKRLLLNAMLESPTYRNADAFVPGKGYVN